MVNINKNKDDCMKNSTQKDDNNVYLFMKHYSVIILKSIILFTVWNVKKNWLIKNAIN